MNTQDIIKEAVERREKLIYDSIIDPSCKHLEEELRTLTIYASGSGMMGFKASIDRIKSIIKFLKERR